ncbi:MAG: M12 family metallo-peptidase, partial [Luminiphilus sp.]|nr:M12 family metallo-peptidase [Luminiphilus sp.]
MDLLSGADPALQFRTVVTQSPDYLRLAIKHPENSKARLSLSKYEPFSSSRKVWLDGKPLSPDQYGGDKIYYRGTIEGDPSSYAFVTLNKNNNKVDFLVGKKNKLFNGALEAGAVRWRAPANKRPSLRPSLAQRTQIQGDPDYVDPPVLTPPKLTPGPSPAYRSGSDTLRMPRSIRIGKQKGWHGPYAIDVPSGANYVSGVNRGSEQAAVYLSTNPNPAAVWPQLDHCESNRCGIADPDAGTYYVSVYRASDSDKPMKVDIGYGNTLAPDDLYVATIAVEIDDKLYEMFDSASAVSDYVAKLFAYNSVVYEREVKTKLQVGDLVILTNLSDPYPDYGKNNQTRLEQVRDHWRANRGHIDRTLVAHLGLYSGGIAYTGTLCRDSWGYSVSGLSELSVPTDQVNANWDVVVNAHELGHNFGSPHTHCYAGLEGNSLPVDGCYVDPKNSTQCFQGTTSLPGSASLTGGVISGRNGTIMSYCHVYAPASGGWGGGNSNIANTFGLTHSYGIEPERVPNLMSRKVAEAAAASPQCLPTLSTGQQTYFTVTATAGTGGTISPGTANVLSGGTTTFEITAENGYEIGSVSGCGGSLNNTTYTTGAVTNACTVTASFSPKSQTALTDGVAASGLSASAGIYSGYYIDVPANTSELTVALAVAEGDPDLYVDTTFPPPTNSNAACRSTNSRGSNEECKISNPAEGRHYIRIYAYSSYSGATLTASLTGSTTYITVTATAGTGGTISPGTVDVLSGGTTTFEITAESGYEIGSVTGCGGSLNNTTYTTGAVTKACSVTASFSAISSPLVALTDGVAVTGLSGSTGIYSDYYIDVPANTSELTVALAVAEGDPDLFVDTTFPPPTNSDAACRSWNNAGQSELCQISNPAEGRHYIRIRAYSTYSGATLTASLTGSTTYITVTATAGTGGTISPGTVDVLSGGTTTFEITAESGYEIGSVSGCEGSLTGTTYTTGAVTSACTVTASFSAASSQIALTNGVTVSGLSGAVGTSSEYYIDVPANTELLTVALAVAEGDPDLYVDT